jgi:hypothetical protein
LGSFRWAVPFANESGLEGLGARIKAEDGLEAIAEASKLNLLVDQSLGQEPKPGEASKLAPIVEQIRGQLPIGKV